MTALVPFPISGKEDAMVGRILHVIVDMISISLALRDRVDQLTSDPFAIGAFHAVVKGILTISAAGIDGPSPYSISSFAPWTFIVGASDTNRRIINKVVLGDDTTLVGNSINAFPSSDGALLPLVYGQEVTSGCSETDARVCQSGCLDHTLVEHKVVVCDEYHGLNEVISAGALGCIVPNWGNNVSQVTPLPAAALSTIDMNLLKTYKNSTM